MAWYDASMATVTAIIVAYNSRKYLQASLSALQAQTRLPDTIVVVFCGNADNAKAFVATEFPQVQIIDPGANLGFAGGNNLAMRTFPADFYLLNNPDLLPEPDYVERLLPALKPGDVGAAIGKLYQYDPASAYKTDVLDTTGVILRPSGRPYDRGQGERDSGQYDGQTAVWGFSGASVLLRASALEAVKVPKMSSQNIVVSSQSETDGAPTTDDRQLTTDFEYFDETFHTYWEDTDLAWRLCHAGYKTVFVPAAVAYHGRGIKSASVSAGGLVAYLKHYYGIAPFIRKNIVANYLFTIIKNAPALTWPVLRRVLSIIGFVLVADVRSWSALARVVRYMPQMLWKRRLIFSKNV